MRDTTKTAVLIFCLLIASVAIWLYPKNNPQRSALADRTLAMRVLAQHLAQKFPGKRALLIANPFTLRKGQRAEIYDYQEAALKGLRQGFGKKMELEAVVYPELRKEAQSDPSSVYIDPKTTTPLSYLVAQNSFDALAREHPNSDILVTLIGLPFDVSRTEIWALNRVKLALLLPDWRTVGASEAVRQAFKSGKIVAAVLDNPGAARENTRGDREDEMAFARRYLLATPETVDELMRRYPQLF